MTKVLRVITRLNIGGPAIHAVLLSSTLNRDGHKEVLVCGSVSAGEGNMAYFAEDKGIDPIVIPDLVRDISFKKDIRALFALYSILRREKPDIIHTHTAKAGTLGRIAALFAGIPIKIHTFHGHIFDGYFSPFKAKVFLLIERILAIFTDKIITVSKTVEHEVIDRLKISGKAKSAVIPLGLELEKFRDCQKAKGSFKKRLGVSDDTFLIGIVGRLVPIKNHRMFLRAARDVIRRSPSKIKFVIVGDGELKRSLMSYADELGLNDHVLFAGWVEDLASVYADLDIVALTSLNEGTPVSLIEAMASGKTVIATDVGGVKDLLDNGSNGIVVKRSDVAAFSDAIIGCSINAEKRKVLGAKARQSVIHRYSKERLVSDIEALYQDLLKESSRA